MKQGISPNNHISGAAASELKGEGAIEKEVECLPESEGIEDRKGEATEEEEEEGRQPKIARVPVKPTRLNGTLTCCSTQNTGAGAPIVYGVKRTATSMLWTRRKKRR